MSGNAANHITLLAYTADVHWVKFLTLRWFLLKPQVKLFPHKSGQKFFPTTLYLVDRVPGYGSVCLVAIS